MQITSINRRTITRTNYSFVARATTELIMPSEFIYAGAGVMNLSCAPCGILYVTEIFASLIPFDFPRGLKVIFSAGPGLSQSEIGHSGGRENFCVRDSKKSLIILLHKNGSNKLAIDIAKIQRRAAEFKFLFSFHYSSCCNCNVVKFKVWENFESIPSRHRNA